MTTHFSSQEVLFLNEHFIFQMYTGAIILHFTILCIRQVITMLLNWSSCGDRASEAGTDEKRGTIKVWGLEEFLSKHSIKPFNLLIFTSQNFVTKCNWAAANRQMGSGKSQATIFEEKTKTAPLFWYEHTVGTVLWYVLYKVTVRLKVTPTTWKMNRLF